MHMSVGLWSNNAPNAAEGVDLTHHMIAIRALRLIAPAIHLEKANANY